ncbi:MAG: 16S rRNA (adenine(1518)-N(6)/adenine(1519)-N(6))-dimethyltransferase RsmA [Coriobacteriia bacterium]|nr:16S rRNA (adenine(1518)-N(6)/adenine(1519)-N(6))-dimethyltransferase RsmA [Coriobacteriia bacterium]
MTYSRLASPRATIDLLSAHGLHTRKSLGQHFLVDDNVVGRILRLAGLSGDEVVVEVGPGIGTLTVALCEAARRVVAIECDPRFASLLASEVRSDALHVIEGDALDVDPSAICEPFGEPDALVANLPYSVAATLVLQYLETLPSLRYAVVMVQAEVADRMSAEPNTKAYGAYTVKLHLRAQPKTRFAVSRSCFLPPPRVDSAVLRLERRQDAEAPQTIAAASRMAEAAFAQRRKTVRNSLKACFRTDIGRVDAVLSSAGIDGSRRAEALRVAEFVALGREALELGLLP